MGPALCWNCFGGHWQPISQRLDHGTSTVLSGELNNHLLTNQFVRKSFLFVLHSYTEISAVTKLAVFEFDQKLFCENPSNALTCIPLTPIMQRLFWRILSSKCCQKIDLKQPCYN